MVCFRHMTVLGVFWMYFAQDALVGVCYEANRHSAEEMLKKQFGEEIALGENELLYLASQQLDEYLSGLRRAFDVPTLLRGTEFQQKVLNEIRKIPYGQTATYGEIAERIGQPKAYRAVGTALNQNPIAILYPCHRVNARDGMLSGYAGGLSAKRKLLEIEKMHPCEIVSENELQSPKLTAYIRGALQFVSPNPALKEFAEKNNVPVAKEETLSFLRCMLAVRQPKTILEVGTAVGYSTLFMQGVCPDAEITTVEKDGKMISLAKENLKNTSVTLLEGDAEKVLSSLSGKFDFAFVDAAKGQYIKYYPLIASLLNPGGIAVYDNVLYKGLSPRSEDVPHKHRTIAKNLNLFNETALHDVRAEATLLPVGDGLLLWVKK